MDSWPVSLALLIAVPLIAVVAARVAAAIPARKPDPASDSIQPVPGFPGWCLRSWLVASLLVAMLSFSGASAPTSDLFWWSLAGPFALVHLGMSPPIGEVVVAAVVLAASVASHPARPCRTTAVAAIVGAGIWFWLGFGAVRVGV